MSSPLPEGGDLDLDDIQPEVEVLPEVPRADLLGQVPVRRGDDARVELEGGDAAHPLEGAVLQGAEELGLGGEADLADLVEEDGAAPRHLEEPPLLGARVGEGARSWPKSSLSMSWSGRAAQSTSIMGPPFRGPMS